MRIGLDIDGVLANFNDAYSRRFNVSDISIHEDYLIIKNVEQILKNEKEFWTGLDVIGRPNFDVMLYCTKRVNKKEWTKEWIVRNGLQNRPIYQMYLQTGNKATMIKGRVDLFIDDSMSNFISINKSGIPCLLYTKGHGIGKVSSLDYGSIIDAYKQLTNRYSYCA